LFERVRGDVAPGSRDARRLAALQETIEQFALIPPKFARYPLVEDILWEGVVRAITGAQSPRAALQAMTRQVEEVMR
jgi:3-methyladenine DNA glycosylase/8-oxoguanine DNA glycosylase